MIENRAAGILFCMKLKGRFSILDVAFMSSFFKKIKDGITIASGK